jgi:flagellar hook assembly protein FlgD
VDKKIEAGNHQVMWNGKNSRGFSVASGLYFAKFTAGNYTKTTKLLLVK